MDNLSSWGRGPLTDWSRGSKGLRRGAGCGGRGRAGSWGPGAFH
jgi:hypothetical protein